LAHCTEQALHPGAQEQPIYEDVIGPGTDRGREIVYLWRHCLKESVVHDELLSHVLMPRWFPHSLLKKLALLVAEE
jgi:hypothetical protein